MPGLCVEGGTLQHVLRRRRVTAAFDFKVAKFWSLLSINTLYFGDLVSALIDKKYLTLSRVVHLFVWCLSRAFWL